MAELLEAWCFKGTEEVVFLFFYFWFILLFCKLLWRDLSELVSVMEHDLGYSMEIHYELCESWLYEGTGEEISGEWRDEKKKYTYEASWKKKADFLAKRLN
jgi:hypothetical protein